MSEKIMANRVFGILENCLPFFLFREIVVLCVDVVNTLSRTVLVGNSLVKDSIALLISQLDFHRI